MSTPYRKQISPTDPAAAEVEKRQLGPVRFQLRPAPVKLSYQAWIVIALGVTFAVVGGGAGVMVTFVLCLSMRNIWWDALAVRLWRQLTLHHAGLAYRATFTEKRVLFDDVDELFLEEVEASHHATFRVLRLKEHGGRSHRIAMLGYEESDLRRLVEAAFKECSLCHLESATKALENGESLELGPIKIDRRGISLPRMLRGAHRIEWGAVVDAGWSEQVFLFRERSGPVHRVPIDQVPHPTLLIALLTALGVWGAAGAR